MLQTNQMCGRLQSKCSMSLCLFVSVVGGVSVKPFVMKTLKDQRAHRSFGNANNSSTTEKNGVTPASKTHAIN